MYYVQINTETSIRTVKKYDSNGGEKKFAHIFVSTKLHSIKTSEQIEVESPGWSGFEANLKLFPNMSNLEFLAPLVQKFWWNKVVNFQSYVHFLSPPWNQFTMLKILLAKKWLENFALMTPKLSLQSSQHLLMLLWSPLRPFQTFVSPWGTLG